MKIYLVGGAVRDSLLGLEVRERDYVVVGAGAHELLALGFRQVNSAFPVFIHPESGAEYALARRERKVGLGYRGFVVETGHDVTIEEDLARRDLTINAIAQDENGCLIDPFQGRADLQSGILRHITPAFQDDPVRLLRIARFAAKFAHLGFQVAAPTLDMLRVMAQPDELLSLVPQRLREELLKALGTPSPWVFCEILHSCGALHTLLPVVATNMDKLPESSSVTTLAPPMLALQRAAAITTDISVRFAAMLGSVLANPAAADELCRFLKVERTLVDLLIRVLTWPAAHIAQATAETMLDLLESARFLHHPSGIQPLVQVWLALNPIAGAKAEKRLTTAIQAVTRVRAEALKNQGLTGPALGVTLRQRRLLAIIASYENNS